MEKIKLITPERIKEFARESKLDLDMATKVLTHTAIGELISAVNKQENRLKTLEDKVKFIMKNSRPDVKVESDEFGKLKVTTLQDLYEQVPPIYVKKSKVISDKILGISGAFSPQKRKEYIEQNEEPTVEECDCGQKPVGRGGYCAICSANWVKKEDVKPTDNSEKIEEDFDDPRDIRELYNDGEISLRKRTVNKQEKIEEIISELKKEAYLLNGHYIDINFIESWLRDKLKNL